MAAVISLDHRLPITSAPELVLVAGAEARRPLAPGVYRRRRLVAVAVLVGVVLGIASFGQQASAGRTAEAEAARAVTVVVQPGDTLWSIAGTFQPDGDRRALVAELTDVAGGAMLEVGQTLVIPGDVLD